MKCHLHTSLIYDDISQCKDILPRLFPFFTHLEKQALLPKKKKNIRQRLKFDVKAIYSIYE